MPKTVVTADIATGRRRPTPSSTIASYLSRPASKSALTWSSKTIEFLANIPTRLKSPTTAKKLTSMFMNHKPPTIPIKINGNDKKIIIVCLKPLNKNIIITNIIKIAGGKATAIPAIDSSESSLCPPHSSE